MESLHYQTTRGGTTAYPPARVSLRWVILAWFLFRSRAALWAVPAFIEVLSLLLCGLLVTGHLHPFTHPALSSLHVSSPLAAILVPVSSLLLLLLALAANTSMTAMANRAVRGDAVRTRDLFRFGGFGPTSLALGVTLLAAVAGSLIFFAGTLAALGLLLAAQSAALRTRRFIPALRASTAVLRDDPFRALLLAAFLVLAFGVGGATGGLGLLVAIPVAKILGAFADAYVEASVANANADAQASDSTVASRSTDFAWTPSEVIMLRQTAPPPQIPHVVIAGLVVLLAGYLLLPDMPADTARHDESASLPPAAAGAPAAAEDTPPVPAETAPQAASQITPQAASQTAPIPAPPAAPQGAFIDSYGPDNFPDLPCQMYWGSYTVRIEQTGSDAGAAEPREQKLTVLDAAGLTVYTVSNESIGLVKLEPLLGGEQPELLIRTEQGGDGTSTMDLALTQQGGVHDVFLVNDTYGVQPLPFQGGTGEDLVVNNPMDIADASLHHFPVLTSTYHWNGKEYENATRTVPRPTQARINDYAEVLARTTTGSEEARQVTAGLLANLSILGRTRVPPAIASLPSYQISAAWLREDTRTRDGIVRAIADAKKSLPIAPGDVINAESGESASP